MKNHAFLTLSSALLLSALTTFGADENTLTKSFTAKSGDNLFMKVDRGSIKIRTSNSDKVEIEVIREVKRASAEKAREIIDKHQVDFTQDGDTIRIEAENQGKLGLFRNGFNNLQVEYTITIPARFNLDLHTSGGNIEIPDLTGDVKARTSGGSLNIGVIDGPVVARTSGGNIRILGGKDKVEAHTSGGSLNIGNIDGDLVAKTSGGNISLDEIKGAIDAQTSGGSIKVSSAQGPIKASSSGGNVSADLSSQPAGDCTFRTSGGSVKVTLPATAAVELDASTSGGRVRSDFPGEFNKHRTKLVATLNGGGPNLILSTSGGNVDVRKK